MSVPVALLFAFGMSGWVLHKTCYVYQRRDHSSISVDTEISFSGSNRRCVSRILCCLFSSRLTIWPEKKLSFMAGRSSDVCPAWSAAVSFKSLGHMRIASCHGLLYSCGQVRIVTSQPRANNQQIVCQSAGCSQQTGRFWDLTQQWVRADTQRRYVIVNGRLKQKETSGSGDKC